MLFLTSEDYLYTSVSSILCHVCDKRKTLIYTGISSVVECIKPKKYVHIFRSASQKTFGTRKQPLLGTVKRLNSKSARRKSYRKDR